MTISKMANNANPAMKYVIHAQDWFPLTCASSLLAALALCSRLPCRLSSESSRSPWYPITWSVYLVHFLRLLVDLNHLTPDLIYIFLAFLDPCLLFVGFQNEVVICWLLSRSSGYQTCFF